MEDRREGEAVRRCSEECHPICDFCTHFDFNGEPHQGTHGKVAMVYVGKGHCRLHDEQRDPEHGCDDFYCRDVAKQDEKREKDAAAMEAVTEELMRLWVGENGEGR